jgi:hypothetical protein
MAFLSYLLRKPVFPASIAVLQNYRGESRVHMNEILSHMDQILQKFSTNFTIKIERLTTDFKALHYLLFACAISSSPLSPFAQLIVTAVVSKMFF